MKTEDQIKALAELDGYEYRKSTSPYQMDGWFNREGHGPYAESFLAYTYGKCRTSYDAIIPLVQKQPIKMQDRIGNVMCGMDAFRNKWFWQATPAQLSEALLKATGRWTE